MLPASLRASPSSPLLPLAWGVVVVLVAVGFALSLYARFDDLGSRQLTADEYYMVRSTEWVAESGVPAFPGGGYYTRGLLQQYATAGLLHAFGPSLTVHRVLPTLFGLLALLAAFAYARRHVSDGIALAVAAAVAASSWEVEFARFIRMYAGLQLFTLLFLVALHRAWLEDRGGRYTPHAMLLLAALCHQLAVALVPLLLVPLFLERGRRELASWGRMGRYLGASAAVGLATAAAALVDFRNLGVADRLPDELGSRLSTPAGPLPLRLPSHPFLGDGLGVSSFEVILLLGLACALWAAACLLRRGGHPADGRLLHAGLFALTAVFHQFVLAGLFLAILVFRYDLLRLRGQPRMVVGLAAFGGAAAAAWLLFAALDRAWMEAVAPGDPARAFRLVFLGFPDYFFTLVVPWREDLPWMGALGALAMAQQLLRLRKAPWAELLTSPALLLLYVATFIAVFDTKLVQTRYAFFVYPVLLTTVAMTVRDGVRALAPDTRLAVPVAAAAFLALFAMMDDFHPRHLMAVDADEASFRTGAFASYEALWYHRHDFASPGEFLNQAEGTEPARVIVVGRDPIEYVLRREFAFFRPSAAGIVEKSRAGGTRDLWSGARMLSTRDDVRRYTRGARTVWLVDGADPEGRALDPAALWEGRLEDVRRAYVSRDDRIAVYRVSLALGSARSGEGDPESTAVPPTAR